MAIGARIKQGRMLRGFSQRDLAARLPVSDTTVSKYELDESLPPIQVPPDELVARLEHHPLVPEIASDPLELFRNGHFNESVRKAAERFEAHFQALSESSKHGRSL